MAISFNPEADTGPDDLGGVDKHYYENKVPPSGPFNDRSFEQAAAAAKDKARVQMIRAIEETERNKDYNSLGVPQEVYDVASGKEQGRLGVLKEGVAEFLGAVVFL